MGTEFFWFYDIMLVAIIIFSIFLGLRKGFVRMLLSLFSTVIAFILAFWLSGFSSDWVYDTFVSSSIKEAISDELNDSMPDYLISDIAKLDFDKITIDGVPVKDIDVVPDKAGKITLKLDNVDLSKTGIAKYDLSLVGIDSKSDFRSINLGTVQFYESEIENSSLSNVIRSHYIADSIAKTDLIKTISDAISDARKKIPVLSGNNEGTDEYLLRETVKIIVDAGSKPGDSLVEGMVKPVVTTLIRTFIFVVFFVIIKILLSFIIRATNAINKIPFIGKFNEFFGGIFGLLQGVLVLFIVIILLHLITILTDNSLIFINEMTISKSFAFNWIYDFKFLDFISKFN